MKLHFKFLLPLFVCLAISDCHGQSNYKFDTLVYSTLSTELFPNQSRTHLFNSDDYSYFMEIFSRNDSIISRITDIEAAQAHYFHMKNFGSWQIHYLKSRSLTQRVKDYSFSFSEFTVIDESLSTTFSITNKRGRKKATYILKVAQTEKNLFSIFKLSVFETLLFTKLVPNSNFVVSEAIGKNLIGRPIKYELNSITDTDVQITVPK